MNPATSAPNGGGAMFLRIAIAVAITGIDLGLAPTAAAYDYKPV